METIGVSEFVREQVKRGGKSELLNISLEEIALVAEKKLNNGEFRNEEQKLINSCNSLNSDPEGINHIE